ncbi:VOC family protein [Agromyces bauzanensis]
MTATEISGLHHVATLVPEVEASAAWYARVLDARRISRLDHHDEAGALTAVILEVPGVPGVLQLRQSDVRLPAGYDPLTLQVADVAALEAWAERLDTLGVPHTGVLVKRTGHGLELPTPEGTVLRFYTAPQGGFGKVEFREGNAGAIG